MSDIPIFDGLTHPTPDGEWVEAAARNNTLAELERQMEASDVRWAMAVGMVGVGGYTVEHYANFVRSSRKKLFPVAYFEYREGEPPAEIRLKLDAIVRWGYVGVKIHPRMSLVPLVSETLCLVMTEASSRHLRVLICTYLFGPDYAPVGSTYWDFGRLLARIPTSCKVMMVHGGVVDLLAMMEIVRPHPNVLLDLSFTLCRYEGSSIDLDIQYLFRSFDRRICVGSDNPQFGLEQLRRRFNMFAQGLDAEKCENIAHRNLLRFVEKD